MKLIDIYKEIQSNPEVNWGEIQSTLAELTTTRYYEPLKTLIGSIVAQVLTQAEDITKVHDGQMSLQAYGQRAYIARVVADKVDSIISYIDSCNEAGGKDGTNR